VHGMPLRPEQHSAGWDMTGVEAVRVRTLVGAGGMVAEDIVAADHEERSHPDSQRAGYM